MLNTIKVEKRQFKRKERACVREWYLLLLIYQIEKGGDHQEKQIKDRIEVEKKTIKIGGKYDRIAFTGMSCS